MARRGVVGREFGSPEPRGPTRPSLLDDARRAWVAAVVVVHKRGPLCMFRQPLREVLEQVAPRRRVAVQVDRWFNARCTTRR